MGVPHLRILRRNGRGASMLCLGVLVHCPSCLGATVTVLAAELLCGDRMFTNWTLESAKTVHHFDGVISHSFKSSRLSGTTPNQSYRRCYLFAPDARRLNLNV
jgi:hypothetical protein